MLWSMCVCVYGVCVLWYGVKGIMLECGGGDGAGCILCGIGG